MRVFLQKKGEYIFVVFYRRKRRVLVSSGVSVREKFWEQNFVKKNHPQYPSIARKLDECLRIAEGVIRLLPEYAPPEEIKKKYLEIMHKKEDEETKALGLDIKYEFIKDFENFIERRRPIYRKNTIKKYVTALNHFLDFEAYSKTRLDILTLDKLVFE
jgi:hypothetical protein